MRVMDLIMSRLMAGDLTCIRATIWGSTNSHVSVFTVPNGAPQEQPLRRSIAGSFKIENKLINCAWVERTLIPSRRWTRTLCAYGWQACL